MNNDAIKYRKGLNLRHYLDAHIEDAFWAGANSVGKRYFKEPHVQTYIAQLQQLTMLTWDGHLISKVDRDELVAGGFAERIGGWNIITLKGIDQLAAWRLINP